MSVRRVAATFAVIAFTVAGARASSAGAAGTAEDEPDTFNVPARTALSAVNSGHVTFTVPTAIVTVTVTCTVSSFSGKTGTTLKFSVSPPVFSDGGSTPCSDSLGQSDTVTSNNTAGAWSVKEQDVTNNGAGDEGMPEPNASGDKMVLTIPKAGLVDNNSTGCVVTAAPNGPVAVTGKYNDAGRFVITNAPVPASSSASCPGGPTTGTATLNATYSLSRSIFDVG